MKVLTGLAGLAAGIGLLASTVLVPPSDALAHGVKRESTHVCREIEGATLIGTAPYKIGMGAGILGTFCSYDRNPKDALIFDYTEYWMACDYSERPSFPLLRWDRVSGEVEILEPYSGKIQAITTVAGFGKMRILPYHQPICREDVTEKYLAFR